MFLRIFCVLFAISIFASCQTPYTGTLGPNNFNGWITEEGDDFVCLANGFDTLCIKAIAGETGKTGQDGKDGNDGVDGKDGKDGNDGVDGKDGKDGNDGVGVNLDDVVAEVIDHLVVSQQADKVSVPMVSAEVAKEIGTDKDVSTQVFTDVIISTIEQTGVDTYDIPTQDVVDTISDAIKPTNPSNPIAPTVNTIVTCETDPNDNFHCAPDPKQAEKNRKEYLFEDPDQGFVAYRHQVTTGKTVRKQVLTPAGAPKLNEDGHKIYEEVPEVLTFSGTIPKNSVELLDDGTLISTVDGSVIAENAEIVDGDTEDEAWENLD